MRDKHTFFFKASDIRDAARNEADYHSAREKYWRDEYEKSLVIVKQTAKIDIREYDVTGGKRTDLVVNYGDASAYARMQEAYNKIQKHHADAERYESDSRTYGSQSSRDYELSTDDVHYFRLGGEPRED